MNVPCRVTMLLSTVAPFLFLSALAQEPTTPRHEPRRLPGMDDKGTVILPNQWSLKPAGKQIKLGDFPVQIALHPTERYAAALHAGYGDHEIVVVDLKRERVVSRVTVPQAFYGICFDREGRQLFASGGEDEVVHRYEFADGFLSEHREIRVAEANETF